MPAPRKLIMHVSPSERIRSRSNSKKRPDNSPGRPLATNYSEHVQLPDVKAQVGKVKARPEFQPCQSGSKTLPASEKYPLVLKSHFQWHVSIRIPDWHIVTPVSFRKRAEFFFFRSHWMAAVQLFFIYIYILSLVSESFTCFWRGFGLENLPETVGLLKIKKFTLDICQELSYFINVSGRMRKCYWFEWYITSGLKWFLDFLFLISLDVNAV